MTSFLAEGQKKCSLDKEGVFFLTALVYEQVSKLWPCEELVLPVVNEVFPVCVDYFSTTIPVSQYIFPFFLASLHNASNAFPCVVPVSHHQ